MMEAVRQLIDSVPQPDREAAQRARERWDSLAKPLGSLGLLEDAIVRVAALTGSEDIALSPRTLLVFCADNGVVEQGVSQCGSEVTAAVARALAEGRSTVSPMAHLAGCAVLPVDVGMRDFRPVPGVLSRRILNGTADICLGPAMQREDCLSAVLAGAALSRTEAEKGTKLLAAGEMSIGNTTTASAVTAALLGCPAAEVTGRGAGLSRAGLERKIRVIEKALALNRPDPEDALDVLAKVGGLEIAAMCGAYLGAAACRVPILIDGCISAAAALCAVRLCPAAASAMVASHGSAEPAAKKLLDALGLPPLITAGMRLGEGSGAVAAMPLLDMALAVYRSGQSFAKLGIAPYVPQDEGEAP